MLTINRFQILDDGPTPFSPRHGRVLETGKRPMLWGWKVEADGTVSWRNITEGGNDPRPPHYVTARVYRAICEGRFE